MSNMLKKGKRLAAAQKKKEVKHHTKEFYKIIGEIDRVSEIMNNDPEIKEQLTEENMVELASPLTHIEWGNLEQFILKGKLGLYHSLNGDIEKATANGKTND